MFEKGFFSWLILVALVAAAIVANSMALAAGEESGCHGPEAGRTTLTPPKG